MLKIEYTINLYKPYCKFVSASNTLHFHRATSVAIWTILFRKNLAKIIMQVL